MRYTLNILLFAGTFMVCGSAGAQVLNKIDSIKLKKVHFTDNKFINNIFQEAVNSAKVSPDLNENGNVNGKSEAPFMKYQGKIIRKINVHPLNFDYSFTDTVHRDHSLPTRIGKRLHETTRKFIIRDNLFIHENEELNAFKVADNERYLRSLDYIQDARIFVRPVKHYKDSVDIDIYTKDVFSIAGGASSQVLNHINGDLYETNLGGMAQRLEFTGLYDYNRKPELGYGGLYRKDNVMHSFIDATVAYSTMNLNSFTHEEETAQYFTLSKLLISPYSRVAGGLNISQNQSYNLYNSPDNLFYRYKYDLFDAWAGYNIGIKQLTANNNTIRDRRFFALRYFNRTFSEVPTQVGKNFDPFFNNTQAVLGQITFFRQDYYRTQYIYGFGTTEDLPYGYNIALTAGWQRQLSLERPYAGTKISQFIATGNGDFIQLYLKAGGYLHNHAIQDGSFLIGATGYSRLIFWNSTKIRQYINVSYTHLYDRVTYAPLTIDNSYGVRGFLSDSVYGTSRLSLQLETEFYLKYKLWGFKFAPFPYSDFSLITPQNKLFSESSLYASVGGGVRARNENLVFHTIELRAYYFPIAPTNMKGFKIILTANVRFRYSSNYISAPDVVQLNLE